MKITTYFFKVMVLLALSGPVCAATANYERLCSKRVWRYWQWLPSNVKPSS